MPNDIALQDLLNMKTHNMQTSPMTDEPSYWHITRVYNGWIYRYVNPLQPNSGHSVFVPQELDVTTREL